MSRQVIHASCVDFEGRGVLILGSSGSGKSALSLQLMSIGAALVSDDRVELRPVNGHLIANAPATIKGLVEARGVGILHAVTAAQTRLVLAVDMDTEEQERLPECHWYETFDCRLPCLCRVDAAYFPAAILQMVRHGRQAT
ncbi:MAG: HPr kinase/phosphatase C-terminal domain-containing protein [Roseobacter sp.]